MTRIGDFAFSGCIGLTSIVIPDSITGIGWGAFVGCSALTSVVISDSVTNMYECAFDSCFGLSDVYYTGTEFEWKKISIGSYNDPLTSATIHYNYVP